MDGCYTLVDSTEGKSWYPRISIFTIAVFGGLALMTDAVNMCI